MAELDLGTVYDFNKEAMKQFPVMDNEKLSDAINKMSTTLMKKHKENPYFMLLCHERRDYTVFKIDNATLAALNRDFKDSLLNRGSVLSIDEQPDGAFEIWIKDTMTGENFAYYLFNYTYGIVEVL